MPRTKPESHKALFDLADRQAGHFTTRQAHDAGISRRLLHHYVTARRFRRIRRGVYRLRDYPEQPYEDIVVWLLWVGEGSVASHETALAIHDLTDILPTRIHITTSTRRKTHVPRGLAIHHLALTPKDIERVQSVPVTTATRTLLDVAGRIDPAELKSALRLALQRGLTTRDRLTAALGSRRSRKASALLEILQERAT